MGKKLNQIPEGHIKVGLPLLHSQWGKGSIVYTDKTLATGLFILVKMDCGGFATACQVTGELGDWSYDSSKG